MGSTENSKGLSENEGEEEEDTAGVQEWREQKKAQNVRRSIFQMFPFLPCRWLAGIPSCPSADARNPGSFRRVTGTLFGKREGNAQFAVQIGPRSPPVLVLDLPIPTNSLVKDMASTSVKITLEAERTLARGSLYDEPSWSVFYDGNFHPPGSGYGYGYARLRSHLSDSDSQMLNLIWAVSMGAGVLPPFPCSSSTSSSSSSSSEHKKKIGDTEDGNGNGNRNKAIRNGHAGDGKGDGSGDVDGELMYMRANFERVVASRDSEAFYMMNPDGSGCPELSIFLLRV